MRVQLLGGFGVEVDGQRVDAARWRPRKARTVVKLLALEPDQRLHREYLLDLLWPGLPPPAAANNLHQALHVARRALIGEGADGLLELRDQVVVLRADGPVEVDAARRDAVGDRARRGTNGAPGAGGDRRAARRRAVRPRPPRHGDPTRDPARRPGVEPRPAHGGGAVPAAPARGLRGRLHAGGRGTGLRRRSGASGRGARRARSACRQVVGPGGP